MPLRIKWSKVTGLHHKNIDQLVGGMIKDEYVEGRRWGFSNVVLKGTSIEGEYIERFDVVTKINDPFGNTVEYPIVQYDRFSFSINSLFPNLEMHGAPRSLSSFYNQIAAYLNYRIAVESVVVDLRKWVAAIERNTESVFVAGALVSDLSLSNSVHSKIAFYGTTEVRPLVKKLTGRYRYTFSKMHIHGISHSQSFKCELFADGRASVLSGIETEISKLLRNTLQETIEEQ